MDQLNALLTKEMIEQKRNEILQKNPELKKKYEELKKQQLNRVGAGQLQPQQELPNCNGVECPAQLIPFAVCCFVTPENIHLTDPHNGQVTFDPTNLVCTAEPFCVADLGCPITVCGQTLNGCQAEVFAIRATGKLPFVVSFQVSNEPVCPGNPSFSNISCDGFACINTFVCLSCNPNACPDFCLTTTTAIAIPIVSDSCGSTAWVVIVDFFLPSC